MNHLDDEDSIARSYELGEVFELIPGCAELRPIPPQKWDPIALKWVPVEQAA